MVISKNGKRKRKEPPPVVETTDVPKRTRVHAQRKFAQGQGPSSYVTNFPSQQSTPVKESSEPPPEILPNLRPKPEDFLTFLCFRGTSVLPPRLDYFNQNKKPETETKEDCAKDDTSSKNADSVENGDKDEEASCPKPSGSGMGNSSDNVQGKDSKVESPQEVKSSFIPFAVRKHAEAVSDGKRRQTVQALKKKYQEQRLAKTQVQNLIKTTQNRRTRSSGKDDDLNVEKKNVASEEKDDNVPDAKKAEEKKKEVQENKNDVSLKRKTSLRNTRNNPPKEDDSPELTKSDPPKAKKKVKLSADEEKMPTNLEKKPVNETSLKESKKEPNKSTSQKQPPTRQPTTSLSQSIETKTKPPTKNDDNSSEFSDSSDDRPLVSAVKKATNLTKKHTEINSSKSPKSAEKKKDQSVSSSSSRPLKRQSPKPTVNVGVSRRSCGPADVVTGENRAESVSRKSDTSEPSAKKKTVGRKKKEKEQSDDSSSEKLIQTKKKTNDISSLEKEKEEDNSKLKSKSVDDNLTKKKRKRRNEFTELSNTEINDSDACRSARPSRKTKVAAAIYMELIGQKLNLGDFDDDGFSMDSFPELPNVKKTQQMENKLKANIGKPTDVKVSPKKNKIESKIPKKDEKDETVVDAEDLVKKEKAKVGRKKKILSPEKDVPLDATLKNEKVLQKSFSDSDDEPLAVKMTKKTKVIKGRSPKKSKEVKETENVESKNLQTEVKEKVKQEIVPEEKAAVEVATLLAPKVTDVVQEKPIEQPKPDVSSPKVPNILPKAIQPFESVFKTPAETSSQLLSPSIFTSPMKPSQLNMKNIIHASAPSSPKSETTVQETKLNLSDVMPSAEESGKIFGIATVNLAQSSGPNDTKCTLGKCGSTHIPLGPVVPTELPSAEPTTCKEKQRRAKVNMSRAQIQKWIVDCAKARFTDLEDDLSMDAPLKPINYLKTASPSRFTDTEAGDGPVPSTSKGPTLKAKLVKLKEKEKEKEKSGGKTELRSIKERVEAYLSKKPEPDRGHLSIYEAFTKKESPSPSPATVVSPIASVKLEAPVKSSPKPIASSAISKPSTSSAIISPPKPVPAVSDKKPIYNQRRTTVYNTKPLETTTKSKHVVNTFGAFSPENEKSIYSFDKEEDTLPTSTPFRRHSRRESNNSRVDEKSTNKDDKSPAGPKQKEVSLTLSPDETSKSAMIAVPINLDISALPKAKPSTGDDSDAEGHTFYIPLQGVNTSGGKSDQIIQGVAVKLGTEGPEGPNQKVIMHAKLVTKAEMGTNITPMPESMASVHDIVKSLIASKDAGCSKSVPIGTVQPRFKSSNVPGTSSMSLSTLPHPPSVSSNLNRQNSSQSLTSHKSKNKVTDIIQPVNNTAFPRYDDPACMVEAPIFRPTDKEFADPMEFIERITPVAARFGICRIIPPSSFKPECKVSDDMRFTAYNLYVHKMLHRWGPSAKEYSAIKKYLATQSITLTQPPWIGGMEVDLPRLYHTVQELGGLKEVIEKKKWARVAEEMCIPKSAQDRITKLDDIYCKYLLPYDTLSPAERQKLFDEVEADWAKAEAKARRNADRSTLSDFASNEDESENDESEEEDDSGSMECIVKGRSMPLSAFFRIARNTMALWFKNTEPKSAEIESEFWRHVAVRDSHVCVHSASIDSSGWGYGFPTPGPKAKGSACAKHPWNLKVLTNNHGSILRSIGPVTGVTVPTLHVGMLFSAVCWYRDPHGLPWIEYLHTGGQKIWYGVPDEQSDNFRKALTSLIPTHCQNKTVWLPCDTAMVPPHMLTDRGVSLCRTEQEPGEFVVVFPRAYSSSVCTGYTISESVYFASNSWLDTAKKDFQDIHDSCEPAMFSLEQLLFAVASDVRTNIETISSILPMITEVYEREVTERDEIKKAGVTRNEQIPIKGGKTKPSTEDFECDICRANLYISWVKTDDDNIYCLQHCLKYIKNDRIQAKQCKLIITYTVEEIEALIDKIKERGNQQSQKKNKIVSKK
ncbi:Protein Jumonji [Pseudolycoriella hygida]|uniref:Protein Jumonji n=1 Tax=Pseudolycoriella hygida TaxID=35572 RepID=A0A9Q0S4Q7_9DIPT|nr:Protein Jumonji [Pseudolycoriella hygida]